MRDLLRAGAARRARGDRGAVLVIAAAYVVVAVVMLAVVVDLGDARQETREVTLSTDAAALAVAAVVDEDALVEGTQDCAGVTTTAEALDQNASFTTARAVAEWYLAENGGTTLGTCTVTWDGTAGYVSVRGGEDVEFAVGPAIGVDGTTVGGVSSALFGAVEVPGPNIPAYPGGGLRPIGICQSSFEDVVGAEIPDGDGYFEDEPYVLNAARLDDATPCPVEGPGNSGGGGAFGFLAYDGKNSSGGQPKPDCSEGGADQNYYAWCGYHGDVDQIEDGYPGNSFKSQSQAYETLAVQGTRFLVPVFDSGSGNGANVELHITHYLEVALTSFGGENDFEFQVYRSYPFASTPPQTSDAHPEMPGPPELREVQPRLCSFSDTPVGDECKIASADTGDAGGDGDGDGDRDAGDGDGGDGHDSTGCSVDAVQPPSATVTTNGRSGKISEAVSYTVVVEDPTACSGFSARLSHGSATIAFDSISGPSGSTFTITKHKNSGGFQEQAYVVQLLDGSGEVIDDSASLTVT